MGPPSSSSQPWTIGRLLEWTRRFFAEHELEKPRLCAEILLAHALGCPKIALYTRFEEVPSPEQRAIFRELVRRSAGGEPIAYLTGGKEFFSLEFEVTPEVLIPRPETETLVQSAIDEARSRCGGRCRILDVGTGCGCIAVALGKYLPQSTVVATDISAAALEVAGRNVKKHGLGGRIQLLEADGLDIPAGYVPEGGFELICCNPPYVAEDARTSLSPAVRDQEPAIALFAGPDGLAFYRILAGGLGKLLASGGVACLEIGCGQEDDVLRLFSRSSLGHVGTTADLAGINRVVRFEKK